jgi:hypothetical protein
MRLLHIDKEGVEGATQEELKVITCFNSSTLAASIGATQEELKVSSSGLRSISDCPWGATQEELKDAFTSTETFNNRFWVQLRKN